MSVFVTVTEDGPAPFGAAGVTHVIVVLLTTVGKRQSTLSTFTVAPLLNWLPVIVTVVPPASGPPAGERTNTCGGPT